MRDFSKEAEQYTLAFLNDLSARFAYKNLTEEEIDKAWDDFVEPYKKEMMGRGFTELPMIILHSIVSILTEVKQSKDEAIKAIKNSVGVSHFQSVQDEILQEQLETPGLADFADQKNIEHHYFLARLEKLTEACYKDAKAIVDEVLQGIAQAEEDRTLQGNFRETNLDWAYSKRYFARQHFEHLLSQCTTQEAKKFLTTSVRKLQK